MFDKMKGRYLHVIGTMSLAASSDSMAKVKPLGGIEFYQQRAISPNGHSSTTGCTDLADHAC